MNKKKPLIGVLPLYDTERNSIWMIPGYMNGIANAGGLPVILPLTNDIQQIEQLLETVDGILITGGHDVSPVLYGEEPTKQCGEVFFQRDLMEKILIQKAAERNMPMLGICRGIQILNVVLGGSLYQDIPLQMSRSIDHHMNPPYDRAVHDVEIVRDSPLHKLLGENRIGVNSYHHQGVRTVSDRLEVMARSDDGLVEAVYMPDRRFVWGVQWHPELSWENNVASRKILAEFVKQSEQ